MALNTSPVGNMGGYSYLYAINNSNIDKSTNKVIKTCIPQTVKVRKYEVDIAKLKSCLRTHKRKSNLSNKQISEKLNKPITLVEHWFRNDKCFSIPDVDIWLDLKKMLNIQTNEFDESILTFELKNGTYEKAERCYFDFGIAPTLTCVNTDEKIILTRKIKEEKNGC